MRISGRSYERWLNGVAFGIAERSSDRAGIVSAFFFCVLFGCDEILGELG